MSLYQQKLTSDWKTFSTKHDMIVQFLWFVQHYGKSLINQDDSLNSMTFKERNKICDQMEQLASFFTRLYNNCMEFISQKKLEVVYSDFIDKTWNRASTQNSKTSGEDGQSSEKNKQKIEEFMMLRRYVTLYENQKKNEFEHHSDSKNMQVAETMQRLGTNEPHQLFDSMNMNRDLAEKLPDISQVIGEFTKNLPTSQKIEIGESSLLELPLESVPSLKGTTYRINRLCTQFPPGSNQKDAKPIMLLHMTKISTAAGSNKPATLKDLIYHLPEKKKPTNLNFRRLA
jgi:hypothetical protein